MAANAKKTESMTEAFETMTAATPEFLKEGYEKAAENMSAFVEFQKSSMEAMMNSAGLFAKGVEKAATEHTAFVKESFEDGVAAAKATAGSKSIQDALSVQNDYVRTAVEKNLAQLNKAADHWMSLTKEAAQPVTEQYGELVEKVQAFRP
ncbi:MAG: phasin family protein [Pseudomonadota bacterium]